MHSIVEPLLSNGFSHNCLAIGDVQADDGDVDFSDFSSEGFGEQAGLIRFRDVGHRFPILPDLKKLSPGPHGLHVHEKASCEHPFDSDSADCAGTDGGHFVPKGTGQQGGLYGDSHLEELSNAIFEADEGAMIPMPAPLVYVTEMANRTIIITGETDRYDFEPSQNYHDFRAPRLHLAMIKEVATADDPQ